MDALDKSEAWDLV
jgi:hypothetical protein